MLFFLITLNFFYNRNIYSENNSSQKNILYLVQLENFLIQNSEVTYQKCFDKKTFSFIPFPLSIGHENHPNTGYFQETFILKIPHAQIQSRAGFIIYQDQTITEFIWKGVMSNLQMLYKVPDENVISIHGKVAVITQPAYHNYWHWISEVLCRLALLELQNIEYDFLYVNQDFQFMKETLKLWGIDSSKIISPSNDFFSIEADEVIAPSMVSNVNFGFVPFSCYAQPHLLRHVQEKLLSAALKHETTLHMSKKIFISRKDSNIRNITNEDEIFELLKPYGFQRYELAKLSVIDQIHLFHQAEVIVSPQGTGLANSIFCNKNVKIVELFQGLNDATFWYLSQELGFNYQAIKTTEFISDYMTAWQSHTYIPPEIVQSIIKIIE